MRTESTPLAVTFSLLAAFSYALLAYLIQTAEHILPNSVLIFFRQLFGLLILLPLIPLKLGSYSKLKTKIFPLHLLRTFASLSSMFCLYFALRYLPLTDAVLLTYTRPLFIPIIVFLWFQTKWTKNTYLGLLIGFLGIVLILRPGLMTFNLASLGAIASAFFGAIAFTTIRRLTKSEPSERITFYYMALSLPLALVPLGRNWETPTPMGWGFLVLIGAVALAYQLFLSRAYRHAKAVKVGSLLYSSVAFAYLFDFFLGKKELPLIALAGMVLIIIGSILALREQKKL
ncbi:MAG: DMT family transporter [Simkaniaceae bacterium]|jgi:drug/metabolite transporter (DMT)-like permease|nr:MAG: DMT family transporter [Simkaniaceae bacterium]